MATEISPLQYYIGQALQAELAKFGGELTDENIESIAERAVKIGLATDKAAKAQRQKLGAAAVQGISF